MLVYYNPHVDDFLAEPLQFRILKRRALKKYGFVFDEARQNGTSIRVLVDGTVSGLFPEAVFHCLPHWLRMALANLEFSLWKRINGFGIELKKVEIPNGPVDEILFAFSYKAATGKFQLRERTLRSYHAVIFHLSHYFVSTAEKAINIKRIPNAYLAGDSDIRGNPYFQRYFDWYSNHFLVLPFAVSPRFKNQKPWIERKAKAVATGSFHDLRLEHPTHKYNDFMEATGATTYHPVRLALFKAAKILTAQVTCKVSPYREYGRSRFGRYLSFFKISQKKYFSINIVDLYNQHRYAIVGEELSGFPALGAFESIACGCLLIAQPEYYKGIGLLPNEHYVPYDGSVENLKLILNNIGNIQSEAIAIRAAAYIGENFSHKAAWNKWANVIQNLY